MQRIFRKLVSYCLSVSLVLSAVVLVNAEDKLTPELELQNINVTFSEDGVSDNLIQGKATANGENVTGRFLWGSSGKPKSVASSGNFTVRFIPDNVDRYDEAEGVCNVQINKADPIGAPTFNEITSSGKTLRDVELKVGTFRPTGSIQFRDDLSTEVRYNVEYDYMFIPTNEVDYNRIEGKVKPWSNASLENKIILKLNDITKVYDGYAVEKSKIKGEARLGSKLISGTYSWLDTPPTKVTNGVDVAVTFLPDDNKYQPATGYVTVRITKGRVEGSPTYTEIRDNNRTLRDVRLSGDKFSVSGTINFEDSLDTRVRQGVSYRWRFIPDNNNYEELTGSITPYESDEYRRPRLTLTNYSKEYDGKSVDIRDIKYTAKAGDSRVNGTLRWKSSAPNSVRDSGYIKVVFKPDSNRYEEVEDSVKVSIYKKRIEGTPEFNKIYTSDKTLHDVNLSKGSIKDSGYIKFRLPLDTKVEYGKSYEWEFEPSDKDNYERRTGSVVLYGEADVKVDNSVKIVRETVSRLAKSTSDRNQANILETIASNKPISEKKRVIKDLSPATKSSLANALVKNYTDVRTNAWYSNDLGVVLSVGLIKGTSTNSISPYKNVTGKEMMAMLVRMFTEEADYKDNKYDWYEPYKEQARKLKLDEGIYFDISKDLTRAEVAKMMHQYVKVSKISGSADYSVLAKIKDSKNIPSEYQEAVAYMYRMGLLKGYEDGSFLPNKNISRIEVISILARLAAI